MINKIWFHADDYGVTKAQSEKILECYTQGVLNSISIIPNSKKLSEAYKLLEQIDSEDRIRRVLHLNFVEGQPLSSGEEVPLLIDKEGYFDKSFIQYFKWNFVKTKNQRKELVNQLKTEIRNQLRVVTKEHDFKITAIDSHQHYHMIPLIFDSLMEVLAENEFEQLNISQIRISVDPVTPLMHNFKMLKRVPIINWIKWAILKIYAGRNKRILKRKGISVPVFFGIFFTCEMRLEVVKELLPLYKSFVNRKNSELELMFHPGNLATKHELLDARKGELADFYMSDNRFLEADCLKMLENENSKGVC